MTAAVTDAVTGVTVNPSSYVTAAAAADTVGVAAVLNTTVAAVTGVTATAAAITTSAAVTGVTATGATATRIRLDVLTSSRGLWEDFGRRSVNEAIYHNYLSYLSRRKHSGKFPATCKKHKHTNRHKTEHKTYATRRGAQKEKLSQPMSFQVVGSALSEKGVGF